MDGFEAEPSQEEAVFDSAAFDTAVDGGLEEQVAETNKPMDCRMLGTNS